MKAQPPEILRWPASFDKAQDLLIVVVDTPDTPIRDTARRLVRGVLSEILGDAELVSAPGQPIRLARPDSPIGISVSHENGLSLLAVRRSGPVGIDLLRTPDSPDWQDQIPNLTLDYLGPKIAEQIAGLPHEEQMAQFAQAWTEHEARLKCRGRALEEWSAAQEEELAPCRVQRLVLPTGYVGAMATPITTE
jgi:4'-phosphopantetheinyl transferase